METDTKAAWRDGQPEVDVLLLSRPHAKIPQAVLQAVNHQRGVQTRLFHGTGWPERTDRNRWHTIARGRNEIKQQGNAAWAFLLDDDVVLSPDCLQTLVRQLNASPRLDALAVDYDREQFQHGWNGHVALGACLFRRSALQQMEFRATDSQCECQCCCDDLRLAGRGITYSRIAQATHLKRRQFAHRAARVERARQQPGQQVPAPSVVQAGTVLAAFDRRDIQRFERQYLGSLRNWRNEEHVIAVAYGLYPSEIRRLSQLPRVTLIPRAYDGRMVPVRRLSDFGEICARLKEDTPVAYWDVADVVFQSQLTPLWGLATQRPGQVLAVREPNGYPGNKVIRPWTLSIQDPRHRQFAFGLLRRNPFSQ